MSIQTQRAALKAAINPVVKAVDIALSVNPPCAVVAPRPPFEPVETFDGNSIRKYGVLLLVPFNDAGDAQTKLDGYIDAVVPAIEGVAGATVETVDTYEVLNWLDGGTEYLSCEMTVQVIA
jgi:hypothetical protein